jgi:two-component system chemotaxis response regulator CheY
MLPGPRKPATASGKGIFAFASYGGASSNDAAWSRREASMKIFLIVDDSPVIRKVARRLLQDLGFVVMEAATGEEALFRCRENMPDAAMVDWDLPDMSGTETIRAITQIPGSDGTKLLYCTSEILVAEMTKAKRAGACGFIMKPFNRMLLTAKLAEIGLLEPQGKAA